MVQFTKLRLSGFKSFVEPTELVIQPGVTGVVGPNGCGKSNLLEGLRWAMGETSSKKLRGSEMEDVIFGGTADRPARNIAEVIINLDNTSRSAPAAFNETDEIEITRRIERGSGSAYRINGKDVRARDVQLVFADAASGARSTALVSQGRVGALVNAKPTDRRGLLEEAAGITGLHSRRHEAELRLRAAENNLERLDDVITAFEGQLQGLKRQARQATRYRNISGHIRKAESILLHLKWQEASAALEVARTQLQSIESQVVDQTRRVSEATQAHGEAADSLSALREAEADAAANLHRLTVAREQLDAEERRIADLQRGAESRLEQIAADVEREQALSADTQEMLTKLEQERNELEAARADEDQAIEAAKQHVQSVQSEVGQREAAFTQLAEKIAADDARRTDVMRQLAEGTARVERLRQRQTDITEERSQLESSSIEAAARAEAEAAVAKTEKRLAAARAEADAAEAARDAAQAKTNGARRTLQDAEAELAKVRAEESALRSLLAAEERGDHAPVVDAVTVTSSYEPALGAALGDDLAASADDDAPLRWRKLPPLASPPTLPAGAQPLSSFVKGPGVLDRRLSQVGVVADTAAGNRLQAELAEGQRLVTQDGSLWRWDGFAVAAGAPTAAGQRLVQRNRLKEVVGVLDAAERRAEAAKQVADAAEAEVTAATDRERQSRSAANKAFSDLSLTRDHLAELTDRTAATSSRLAVLTEAADTTRSNLAEAEDALASITETQANFGDPEVHRPELDRLRQALAEQRAELVRKQQEAEQLVREVDSRTQRLASMETEAGSWRRRAENAAGQMAQLNDRRAAVQAEIDRLAGLPEEISEKRNALLSFLEEAEAKRRTAADQLAVAETRVGELAKELRANEARFADHREQRGLAEGTVRQAEQAIANVAERITERLSCRPENALEAGGVAEGEALPELEAIETRLARLTKERDNMGPVNLRADEEATELATQIESLQSERSDLIAAINKFRHAISELNQEGRERLIASFEAVDRHFRELFTRLFGGGRAHLRLVESDDPLEAGLEIMASPPGKRLQTLSLLSGGEQALTALSLLFAVFLTNPAPICVLDEVDAPLDDANVDRFCTLVEQIAHTSETRFLVITHHRMTMARVDRLFGVTMPERGVSQLVSVDLQVAENIRESA